MVTYDRKLSRSPLVLSYGKSRAFGRALDFLVRMTDEDVPLDEALNALSALAEQFQSGAIVGGTLIDSSSATFDRVVYL